MRAFILAGNDPDNASGTRLATSGDFGCDAVVGQVWKTDLHQTGNRGIALIGMSPHLTETVNKTNPPHHTHNRQRVCLWGDSRVCLTVHQEIFVFQKKFTLRNRRVPFSRLSTSVKRISLRCGDLERVREHLGEERPRERPRDTNITSVCRSSKAKDCVAGGMKSPQGARNHSLFVIALPENARERDHVATRPTKAFRLVDFCPAREFSICQRRLFSNRWYSEVGNNSRTRVVTR